MKIAMIGQKGMPAKYGGVERHVHDLSIELSNLDHEVIVYGRPWYSGKKDSALEGVQIKILPSIKTKHLDTISHTLVSIIHAIRLEVDIIHFHGIGPSLISFLVRLFAPKIKVVTTFHSIDRKHEKWGFVAKQSLKLAEWTACRFAHETIVVSPTILQYVRDVYDCDATYVPNGITEPKQKSNPKFLKKYKISRQKYIVAVSRLVPHKGIHYLIKAFDELKAYDPKLTKNLKLVIVGDGHHTQNYVSRLKKMAKANKQIIFTGFKDGDELNTLFQNAKLFVHPSDQEGLPINVLEAMSHKLPIVVSDIPEHKTLIKQNGLFFAHGNTEDLANTLHKALSLSDKSREMIGQKHYNHVMKDYNWKNIVHDVEKVYKLPIKTKIQLVPVVN